MDGYVGAFGTPSDNAKSTEGETSPQNQSSKEMKSKFFFKMKDTKISPSQPFSNYVVTPNEEIRRSTGTVDKVLPLSQPENLPFNCKFCERCFSTSSGKGNHQRRCEKNKNFQPVTVKMMRSQNETGESSVAQTTTVDAELNIFRNY